LFSALGIFCAAAIARRDYLLIGGRVFADSKPLSYASLTLLDVNASTIRKGTSDARGRFLFSLKFDEFKDRPREEKPATLLVKATDYGEQKVPLDGSPNEHLAVFFDSKHAPH